MNIKPGDTVRYLNAVGGGTVTRVDGRMVYVDEDGFETPVLMAECVVVGNAQTSKAWQQVKDRKDREQELELERLQTPKAPPVAEPDPVPVETPGGDVLNITLGFEAEDLKHLSDTVYTAYLVNDSNYWLAYAFATREDNSSLWTPRANGLLEPNYEGKLCDLTTADLPHLDHLYLSLLAFKKDRPFAAVAPIEFIRKADATKFARLHCFRPHRYFDVPVIAWDIIRDGHPVTPVDLSPLLGAIKPVPKAEDRPVRKSVSKPARKPDPVTVIDLHINNLLDNTAGLSPADILNYQIDVFRREMDARVKLPGCRLVFIHGKGNGVLRAQILKELNHRYKGHDVRDASFAEYGFGATEVIIRANPDKSSSRS